MSLAFVLGRMQETRLRGGYNIIGGPTRSRACHNRQYLDFRTNSLASESSAQGHAQLGKNRGTDWSSKYLNIRWCTDNQTLHSHSRTPDKAVRV